MARMVCKYLCRTGSTHGDMLKYSPLQAAIVVQILTIFCCWNAFFTFFRKRHYRLFEQPVDEAPATPSARRVRVDSSPMSASPLHYLQSVISSATAASRAYPDPKREVWEVRVWDPKPFHLTLFTLFSPGHLLLYYSLLPTASLDARPSLTLLKAIVFSFLLSVQLGLLKTSFSQQSKDTILIQGEVLNEYDTKFVRPSLHHPVRDVGTQIRESALTPRGTRTREVDVYTPTTIVNRGFRTNPNTNYASQYDPDNLASQPDSRRTSDVGIQRSITSPSLTTPAYAQSQMNGYTSSVAQSRQSMTGGPEYSSPLKPHHELLRARVPAKGDGGSLGVYSHSNSPLRKTASSSQLLGSAGAPQIRPSGSPLKRVSTSGAGLDGIRGRQSERY